MVGGFDEDLRGRCNQSKQLVGLAVEKVINKEGKQTIGRAYAKVIEKGGAENLKPFFEEKISKDCAVKTDGWRGYLPLKKDWQIEQEISDKGKNFKELHTHIMNIKLWLKAFITNAKGPGYKTIWTIFIAGFNQRGFTGSILEKLLARAVQLKPVTYKQIIKAN